MFVEECLLSILKWRQCNLTRVCMHIVDLCKFCFFLKLLSIQVSKYTGRIHLYSCIPGIDSRPRPFFENFRPEEVECCPPANDVDKMFNKSMKDNPLYRGALMEFIHEWKKLRPIEKRKLIGKPLQLPLSCELCYLSESINHKDGVCI